MVVSSAVRQLRLQAEHRIRKKQTGNEACYGEFMLWLDEWLLDASQLGSEQWRRIAQGFLVFPPDQFFWDRVFEIWCLQEVAASIARCGGKLICGPLPLTMRRKKPIYKFERQGQSLKVWYQKPLPSNHAAWSYDGSGQPLRGTPDVTVTHGRDRVLIVDAKNRLARGATRAEETYKMLGYLENYDAYLKRSEFCCILCFLSNSPLMTVLSGPGHSRLAIVGVHPNAPTRCCLSEGLDTIIDDWVKGSTGVSP